MSAFTDLEDQVNELSDNFDQYTSDNDQNISDMSDMQSQHDDAISTLQDNSGQLQFPLSQDTIDLIMEQFPTGTVTLASGAATITDPRISPSSIILLTNAGVNGTPGVLTYSAGTGSASISSYSTPAAADNSTIAYLILN